MLLRVIVLVLLSGSLWLPPAQAAVSLSLVAPSAVAAGEEFTLSGKASGALVGTVVQLQRKSGDSWVKLASKKLTATKTYKFIRTQNAVGVKKFRIHMNAQQGQTAKNSPVRTIEIKLGVTAEVATTVTYEPDVSNRLLTVDATLAGMSETAPPLVHFQVETSAGVWSTLASNTPVAGELTFTHPYPEARRLRLRVVADVLHVARSISVNGNYLLKTFGLDTGAAIASTSGEEVRFTGNIMAGITYTLLPSTIDLLGDGWTIKHWFGPPEEEPVTGETPLIAAPYSIFSATGQQLSVKLVPPDDAGYSGGVIFALPRMVLITSYGTSTSVTPVAGKLAGFNIPLHANKNYTVTCPGASGPQQASTMLAVSPSGVVTSSTVGAGVSFSVTTVTTSDRYRVLTNVPAGANLVCQAVESS